MELRVRPYRLFIASHTDSPAALDSPTLSPSMNLMEKPCEEFLASWFIARRIGRLFRDDVVKSDFDL